MGRVAINANEALHTHTHTLYYIQKKSTTTTTKQNSHIRLANERNDESNEKTTKINTFRVNRSHHSSYAYLDFVIHSHSILRTERFSIQIAFKLQAITIATIGRW